MADAPLKCPQGRGMFGKVLVGVDGSIHADRALEAAITIAERFHSELTVAAVLPLLFGTVEGSPRTAYQLGPKEEALRSVLGRAQEKAKAGGVHTVYGVYLQGHVSDVLLEYLAHKPQDLVVVGSRGLSLGGRPLLGSVSVRLVYAAPCPVLVVRPTGDERRVMPEMTIEGEVAPESVEAN